MKSQLFDIRREYKKGRLTPGNLNDNPFEQFDHWLNDAISIVMSTSPPP